MNKLNKLAKLLLEYPEEHSMLKDLSRKYAGVIPYSDESGAKGLSTTQQLGYAFQRGIIDNTQSGAKAVATGQANVTPTAKQVFTNAFNSKIFDWTLTSLAAMADAIPVVGIPISIGIAQGQVVKSAAKADWLSVAFSILSMYPYIGDALSVIGRAIKNGVPVSTEVAKNLVKAFAKITNSESRKAIARFVGDLFGNKGPAYVTQVVDNSMTALNNFTAQLNQYALGQASRPA
jgi:hypothetical protein